jgi:hypothetical protein
MCKRGVRQGDPLSPILYVLGGDLLQDAINDYVQQGKLKLPILTNDPDFPVVQYADDTILVLSAELDQIMALKEVLNNFLESTGLKINYHKSLIVPLNVSNEDAKVLAAALGCQVG